MHMADALVSPAVGIAMTAVSAGTVAWSVNKMKGDVEFDDKKIPMMGVMGAFVFAGQMINFTIPGTGSSGHIGGGILLAALLGKYPSFLTLSAVLIIQSLFFADGGLLALGCNIFNMGVIPCLLIYPLIFKPMLKQKVDRGRIALASVLSVVLGLQLGAFAVVLETLASGITELPFNSFVILMQPIHLAIGIAEGVVTAAVLNFVYSARPELLKAPLEEKVSGSASVKKVLAGLLIGAVVLAGGVSLYASGNPDGLEWAMENVAGTAELEARGGLFDGASRLQEITAFLPDYGFKSGESSFGTGISGLVGCGITIILAGAIGAAIYRIRIKRTKEEN